MSAPVRHDDIDPLGDIAKSGLPGKTLAAEEILKSELNRRFTDRQNVDFGMSRVIRDGTRLHMGPTMDRTMIRTERPQSRPTANGRYETLIDGTWVSMDQLKPLLHPENDQEKAAVQTFKDQKVDVALYTAGGFGGDDGSKITGPVVNIRTPIRTGKALPLPQNLGSARRDRRTFSNRAERRPGLGKSSEPVGRHGVQAKAT